MPDVKRTIRFRDRRFALRNAHRCAFTLVELLVVVAIIAILLAILVPYLRAAREQTKRVVCACNQRSIYLATESYAVDYGVMPIMNRQGYDINYRSIAGKFVRQDIRGFGPDTWAAYLHPKAFWTGSPFRGIIFQVDIKPTMTERDFGEWRNFGLLWSNRAFADPRALFCPSQRNRFYAWNNPYNPWPPALRTIFRPDDPGLANHTESSYERRLGLTGLSWDRIDRETALFTDRLLDDDDAPEIVRDTHGGINVLYRDGHRSFVRDRRLLTWIPAGPRYRFYEAREQLLQLYDWLDHLP
jgi:prepilin-type N-terminal cleavage/methylation domain-containing protein